MLHRPIPMTRRRDPGQDRAMQPAPQGYRAVTLAEERRAEVLDIDSWAFAGDVPDEDTLGAPAIRFPWDRAVGIEDADGSLVAFHSSYPFTMPVPGGSVPTAGLTWVGVHPAPVSYTHLTLPTIYSV